MERPKFHRALETLAQCRSISIIASTDPMDTICCWNDLRMSRFGTYIYHIHISFLRMVSVANAVCSHRFTWQIHFVIVAENLEPFRHIISFNEEGEVGPGQENPVWCMQQSYWFMVTKYLPTFWASLSLSSMDASFLSPSRLWSVAVSALSKETATNMAKNLKLKLNVSCALFCHCFCDCNSTGCTALHCTVLCCAVLCCAVLCCAALYRAVLCHALLQFRSWYLGCKRSWVLLSTIFLLLPQLYWQVSSLVPVDPVALQVSQCQRWLVGGLLSWWWSFEWTRLCARQVGISDCLSQIWWRNVQFMPLAFVAV